MTLENYDLLSDSEKASVVALPYRVGLWLSTLDQGGGDLADEIESLALVGKIESIARDPRIPFTAYVCRQTLTQRTLWLSWSESLSKVPEEAQIAIQSLMRRIPQEDVDEYRSVLFRIAVSVARAYRERKLPEASGVSGLVGRLLGGSAAAAHEGDDFNISATEKKALLYLAEMMALNGPLRFEG